MALTWKVNCLRRSTIVYIDLGVCRMYKRMYDTKTKELETGNGQHFIASPHIIF